MTAQDFADPDAPSRVERAAGKIEYQPALDGLRGLAVLLVLVYHDGLIRARPSGLHGGFLGVDVFFVLSGYLITSLLLAEHSSTGRIAFGAFWARRARRLLPAMFVTLLGVALYSKVLASPAEQAQIRGDAIATLFYVQNWHLILHHHLFGTALDHTWSLSVEEQWYLAWPLLLGLMLSWRWARRSRVFAVIVGLAAASALWTNSLYRNGSGLAHVYYGTDARAQELLIGAALAVLLRRASSDTDHWPRAVELLGLAGCFVVGAIVATSTSGSRFFAEGGYALFAVAVAVVIAAAVRTSSRVIRPALSVGPLRKAGLISYGLYLYHWPLFFWLSSERTHFSGVSLFIVRMAVASFVATVSFVLIERPIRRGALTGVRMWITAPVAVAVVLAAMLAATRPSEPPPPSLVAIDTVAQFRQAGAQPGRRVLVVGRTLAFGLGIVGGRYTRDGWNASSIGFLDCNLIQGDTYVAGAGVVPAATHCDQMLPALKALRSAFRPDVVVFLPGSGEPDDRVVGSQVLRLGTRAWADHATAQLDAVFGALRTTERTTVLLANVPCNGAPSSGSALDQARHSQARQHVFNQFLLTYAREHRPLVTYGDLDHALCREGTPIRSTGKLKISSSNGVLTRDGDQYLWRWIIGHIAS